MKRELVELQTFKQLENKIQSRNLKNFRKEMNKSKRCYQIITKSLIARNVNPQKLQFFLLKKKSFVILAF